MGKAGIRIGYPGFCANRLDNVINRPRDHLPVSVTQKNRASFPIADENDEVAEVFVVNNRNDPGFAAFALLNHHSFALNIEVTDIELDEFTATNPEPPERFNQTAIAKIGRGQE